VVNLLKQKNLTLGVAESCTGGQVAATLTKLPGVSAVFQGGVVAYSNDVKHIALGVRSDSLAEFGAVSEPVVCEMAEGVCMMLGTDVGIATSGIAGPDGGTPDKPVGTIWIACATPAGTVAKLLRLGQYRDQNITLTTNYVLNLLREQLKKDV
jgi:nicotinamide-nucleotide amidase